MKGGGGGVSSAFSSPSKKRWKGLVIAVLGLVFLSMLVPLVFLLGGLQNGFHGFVVEQPKSGADHLKVYEVQSTTDTGNQSKVQLSTHVNDIIRRFTPTFPKDFGNKSVEESKKEIKGSPIPSPKQVKKNRGSLDQDHALANVTGAYESDVTCEIKFGIYCLWRREQREKMEDLVVKRMKDLLFVARAYYPSIAKLPKFDKLSHEMKQNIQEFERVLSETSTDKDLPRNYEQRIKMMEATISKAKSCPHDCSNVDKKFRQLADLTEDEANFHMKQSAFLYKLAVQTMPKSIHCLSMRLTVEFFRSSLDNDEAVVSTFVNPDLNHYAIFSRNILAASVVINSTVVNANENGKMVFHLLTDRENYFAMKLWFSRNKYGDAAVQVLNIDNLKLYTHLNEGPLHLSLPDEYRISFQSVDKFSSLRVRTEYLSLFSHSHYLLPEIFQSLDKIVVLDDDVVVQRDLSTLWNLDMGGKTIGSVQFCGVKLSDLKNNLVSILDENACAWTSGVNIVDLSSWRAHNLSQKYQRLAHELSKEGGLSETSKLSASLLTFQDLVYPLDDGWMLSGLGHNYGLDLETLSTAGVLHYDGGMKPWLDLGIPHYKSYWRKFLNSQDQFLNDCNVNQ